MSIDSNKIKITEKALSYLKRKEKTSITIGFPDYRTNGDFAVVPVPEIFAKKPRSVEEYNMVNINGIDVYLSRSIYLPENNDIVVDLDSFLRMNFLTVTGFDIKNQ